MGEVLESYCTFVLLAFIVHRQLLLTGGKHSTHLTVELGGCWRPAPTRARSRTHGEQLSPPLP